MNPMVERVARVICAQWGERDKAFIDKRWHLQIPVAQAVIAAMREPTEAMLDAGDIEIRGSHNNVCGLSVWQLMIDAALK